MKLGPLAHANQAVANTYNAVVSVQKHAFPNDSSQWDGQVGTKTWAKLRSGVWW